VIYNIKEERLPVVLAVLPPLLTTSAPPYTASKVKSNPVHTS
jgi:hypothetical protein